MTGSVVRAWGVGHSVAPTAISLLALGAVASFAATTLIPGLGARLPIPVWALVPPMLAILSSLGVVNSLPELSPPTAALVIARAGWLTAVLLVGAASAGLVTVAAGFHGLVEATVLLIALTYAAAALVGRGSVVVGGALVVYVVTNTQTYADLSGQEGLLYAGAAWHWAGGVVALVGCLGFVWRGGNR
ncbi:membrane hypothetical protein [metagenome]|uniref:Uncharacterized protein n=1 Tax=metagenome TaxID=256318 RepID=A0A2P2CFQ5_9ZZZZ